MHKLAHLVLVISGFPEFDFFDIIPLHATKVTILLCHQSLKSLIGFDPLLLFFALPDIPN